MADGIYYLEALLLAVLGMLCIHATITDLKSSIIPNRLLLVGACLSLVGNGLYYGLFARAYLLPFLVNLAAMSCLSVLFYAMHIWAAGDSKLLMVVVSLIPARLYAAGMAVATVAILIATFSLAFLYYVAESVVLGIRERKLFPGQKRKLDVPALLVQYGKCTCVVTIAGWVFSRLLGDFYAANAPLFMLANMLLVMAVCNLKILDKWYVLVALLAAAVAIFVAQHRSLGAVNLLIYPVVLVVLLLRLLAEKDNYKVIPTSQVKAGMVLSQATVLLFLPSRIKGLPTATTEDIRSRLTPEEAESVARWEHSRYGQPQITIVRKIPFAVFIALGSVVFIVTRMLF